MSPHRKQPTEARRAQVRQLTFQERFGYLSANAFELFTCLLGILACVQFFANPEQLGDTAVGTLLHPWDYAWNTLYGIGSLLVVCGLVAPSPRVEVAGLSVFSGAVAINALALFTVYGSVTWATAGVYLGFVCASAIRARWLWSLNVLDTED